MLFSAQWLLLPTLIAFSGLRMIFAAIASTSNSSAAPSTN